MDYQKLFDEADKVRREHKGEIIPIRGIVELSNCCENNCLYCGIRASAPVTRYRVSDEEVIAVAHKLQAAGIGTIVIQAGETHSPRFDENIAELVRRIKRETSLTVTLSLGNRERAVYDEWRKAGAGRYLLRFECADAALFAKIHPNCTLDERLRCIEDLKSLGYEAGSGFMIGLPGEDDALFERNISLARDLELRMIGIGPFIPSPVTPLGNSKNRFADNPEMFYVALARLRLACPDANIPATTAFAAIGVPHGRWLALRRGANVFMPNVTPPKYHDKYDLYPGKHG